MRCPPVAWTWHSCSWQWRQISNFSSTKKSTIPNRTVTMIDLLLASSSASGNSLRNATERRVPTAKLRKQESVTRLIFLCEVRKRDAATIVPIVPERLNVSIQTISINSKFYRSMCLPSGLLMVGLPTNPLFLLRK